MTPPNAITPASAVAPEGGAAGWAADGTTPAGRATPRVSRIWPRRVAIVLVGSLLGAYLGFCVSLTIGLVFGGAGQRDLSRGLIFTTLCPVVFAAVGGGIGAALGKAGRGALVPALIVLAFPYLVLVPFTVVDLEDVAQVVTLRWVWTGNSWDALFFWMGFTSLVASALAGACGGALGRRMAAAHLRFDRRALAVLLAMLLFASSLLLAAEWAGLLP